MLDFFKVLKRKIPQAKFLFITPDERQTIIDNAISKGINAESIICKKASRNEVPMYASLSNASVFFIRPTYSKRASSPTKQGELMSLGIPIACNTGVGDTTSIVQKYNSGVLIESFDDESYSKAIDSLNFLKFNKLELHSKAQEYFGLNTGIEKYNSIYKKLLHGDI